MKKAETDVQFFSHLNGLVLDNKWGDMIRLLDTCLVYGLKLPDIQTIEIQDEGKILIEFKSQHKCLLFQCVTLSDFTPNVLNDKYRIVGVPTQTQILISSDLEKQSIDKIGTASLSSLDYEIVFSANNKRVYRAKNPTPQHPFIRVDESTASEDGSGIYNENYAKYAMVGLHENMRHIDDYSDSAKIQLPCDPKDRSKNYKISGKDKDCVRGWSRWYYATTGSMLSYSLLDTSSPRNGTRNFTIFGNQDAFYLNRDTSENSSAKFKQLSGCGLFLSEETKPWFLMSTNLTNTASTSVYVPSQQSYSPLAYIALTASFICSSNSDLQKTGEHNIANPILPDFKTGLSGIADSSSLAALSIPFIDNKKFLRGSLAHVYYSAKKEDSSTKPMLSDKSMYLYDVLAIPSSTADIGGIYVYLGEIE